MKQGLKWWFTRSQWKWWFTPNTRKLEVCRLRFLKGAGLISLDTNYGSLHLGVYPRHWVWGHEVEEYDCSVEYLGFGPLFMLVRLT